MATRMQQRRGTAAQWTSSNPILNAGEMGWESDTNKFKIGDGTNHWADLDYFADINSTINPSFGTSIVFEGATTDSYETTLQVTDPTADRTITLPNVNGTVITTGNLSDITDIGVFTSTIVMEGSSADDYELTLSAGNPTADRTITFPDNTGTVALTSDIAELSQDAINSALVAGTGITKSYNDGADTLTLSVDTTTIQARVTDVSDTEIGYLNGVTSAIQTQLDAKSTDSKTETLTNKSINLSSNTLTSTLAQLNTAVSDADVASLAGAETLTNKTINLSSNTLSGTTAEFNTALSDSNFVTTGDTGTVTSTMIADGTIVNGDINASAAIALSKLATDPLARANHTGTQAASTISDFDTQVRTSKVTDLAAPTGSFSMNSQKITSLATPTADADAATKAYVDAATAGLNVHASVQAATTANINLSNALENGDTLDGVTLATGNRVLVKNQTDKTENGVYIVPASGAASRATDYDSTPEVDAGDFIFVEAGTVNGKTGYVQTNVITTIGSDNIEFTQFSGAGTYSAGTGLTLTGTTFSINTGTTVDLNTAQTLTNKTINLSSNTLSGTTAQFNTALSDGDFATLAGSETLTNKTIALGSNTISGTLAQFNTAVTDADFASLAGSETLTNKTINGSNNTITNVAISTAVSGLGTGIATFLGTPSSANLASAVTDETGSGALVFGTAPSFTTAITLNATGELRLADTDSSNYVGFKAPGTVSANKIWILPSADGTSGQTLSTDGSGTLSWSTPSAGAAFSEFMLIGA